MFKRSLTMLTYRTRYAERLADHTTGLGGPHYIMLQTKLDDYLELLMKYGVKQTEMERVKKLGAQLGFKFPEGKKRAPKE